MRLTEPVPLEPVVESQRFPYAVRSCRGIFRSSVVQGSDFARPQITRGAIKVVGVPGSRVGGTRPLGVGLRACLSVSSLRGLAFGSAFRERERGVSQRVFPPLVAVLFRCYARRKKARRSCVCRGVRCFGVSFAAASLNKHTRGVREGRIRGRCSNERAYILRGGVRCFGVSLTNTRGVFETGKFAAGVATSECTYITTRCLYPSRNHATDTCASSSSSSEKNTDRHTYVTIMTYIYAKR